MKVSVLEKSTVKPQRALLAPLGSGSSGNASAGERKGATRGSRQRTQHE
jgi:hypothetical protein